MPDHTKKRLARTRLPLSLWLVVIYLAIASATRFVLLAVNFDQIMSTWYLLPVSLALGFILDLYVALCVTLPPALFMFLLPLKWRQSRFLKNAVLFPIWLFTFGLLYLAVTEFYFFEEFSSRFNYIAVDYLIYPHEVFVNLWDTYPVLSALIITSLVALVFIWFFRQTLKSSLAFPDKRMAHAKILLGYSIIVAAGLFILNIDSSRISDNRILNEITNNGVYSFVDAAMTNELDYDQYYACLNERQALDRLKKLLADDHTTFIGNDSAESIDRHITSDNPQRRFNIVLVIEESFGTRFVGALHSGGQYQTPCFDSLAAEHSTLFTHLYATGNRTVRGIEATLASFPPIPGRSIVKRPGSDDIFTLPGVFKELGYNTVFVYAGMSYFDNIGAFASNNGYDRVFDELDFKDPIFKTIWGVCDEDLFNKSIETFDSLQALGAPFFATLLTVSNHSPYTYPPGRIEWHHGEGKRETVVRYADYSIGKFIDDAKGHAFFDSTLFVFVADHGARVYGAEQIPLRSYEIPLLFYNPIINPTGNRCDVVGSQMDIAPTILDQLGIEYNSEFFGRSLLSTPPDKQRVLMSHNRDVSLMRDSCIGVLGIRGDREICYIDSSLSELHCSLDTLNSPLVDDAIAYYMTAYHMYRDHRLHPLTQNQ